jgi:hypothetical protein
MTKEKAEEKALKPLTCIETIVAFATTPRGIVVIPTHTISKRPYIGQG